jgi:hypothetical protein
MIEMNRVRNQKILKNEEGHEYVASFKSQALLLDKLRTQDLAFSSLLSSSRYCLDKHPSETIVLNDLLGKTKLPCLHVPSPIPIPPLEVLSIPFTDDTMCLPKILTTSTSTSSTNTSLPSEVILSKKRPWRANDENSRKIHNVISDQDLFPENSKPSQLQSLRGTPSGIKRSKTCKSGLDSQASFKKKTDSLRNASKFSKMSRPSYPNNILFHVSSSMIDLYTAAAVQSIYLPKDKFKVPNPLEPETVPAVIEIPCKSPDSALQEDFLDDISELGLDDHEHVMDHSIIESN